MKNSAARSNMIKSQLFTSGLQRNDIVHAMEEAPREIFVPDLYGESAYADDSIPFGGGRYMPSPLVIAKLFEAAEPDENDNVLIVAGAVGYSSDIAKRICNNVVMVEERADLVSKARALLGKVEVITAPLTSGCASHQPYDIILIEGAVSFVPDNLLNQLSSGGRLVAVKKDDESVMGRIVVINRNGEEFVEVLYEQVKAHMLPGFSYRETFVF